MERLTSCYHVHVAECGHCEDDCSVSCHCKFHSCDDSGIGSWYQHGWHHSHPVTGGRPDVRYSCQQRTNCCHTCCYTGSPRWLYILTQWHTWMSLCKCFEQPARFIQFIWYEMCLIAFLSEQNSTWCHVLFKREFLCVLMLHLPFCWIIQSV